MMHHHHIPPTSTQHDTVVVPVGQPRLLCVRHVLLLVDWEKHTQCPPSFGYPLGPCSGRLCTSGISELGHLVLVIMYVLSAHVCTWPHVIVCACPYVHTHDCSMEHNTPNTLCLHMYIHIYTFTYMHSTHTYTIIMYTPCHRVVQSLCCVYC